MKRGLLSARLFIVACQASLVAAVAAATDLSALLPSLKEGGYVIVLRHGPTSPEQSDVYPLNFNDMGKQRQLSEQGKQVAREMGAALKSLGIPLGKVYTSHLNRAIETGRLVSGSDVTWKDELNDSGMGSASAMAGASGTGNERFAVALRQLVSMRPEPHTNTLIVTHKTNIQDAFGKEWSD